MSRIRIKNFGPIKEGFHGNDGWLDIKKITVFIGDQGSGKSTVAKLISTFTWIEKALVRGDYDKGSFKEQYLSYHRLENYLKIKGTNKTVLEYEGAAFSIKYKNGSLITHEKAINGYPLPQIMYVPAERNFIAYVKSPKELKLSSESLKEFLTEYENAKIEMGVLLKLPINNVEVKYDKVGDLLHLHGADYDLELTEASSGFQSLVPLYLVSNYLANSVNKQSKINKESMSSEQMQRFRKEVEGIWNNKDLTNDQRRITLSVLSSKFNKTAFVNIVEEPEQNLFPSSQRKMLNSLLALNNLNPGNKLIMTTHSPYLINYLTLAVKAGILKERVKDEKGKKRIEAIVPLKSTINPSELVIYELCGESGTIKVLESYHGLPSDENELNERLDESNELFAQLLEIQQSL